MNFSFSSVLNASLFGLVLIGSIYLFGKSRSFLRKINPSILILLAYIILLRLICPIEFPFTISVYYKGILSSIQWFIIRRAISVASMEIQLTTILFAVWLIGCFVASCRYVVSYHRTKKLLELSDPVEDGRIEETICKINKRIGRDKAFHIVYMPGVSTPMVFGPRDTYIILPEKDLPEDEIFYVLYHELIHYYRGHLYIKIMFALLICVYWWNPFIYVLNRFVTDFLEMEVDNIIADDLEELDRIAYMECLLRKSKMQLRKNIISKNSVTFCERNTSLIARRIELICDKTEQKNDIAFSGIVVAAFLAVFIISSTLIFEPYTYKEDLFESEEEIEEPESLFVFADKGTFVVRNENGEYDVYCDFVYVLTVDHLLIGDKNVRIYNTLEEALENEK